ncbi:hypothetical protein OC846_000348 [Tilletia horrida]|uniref:Sulfatase-modifying factor enzyme domain-containing protein n=1 Tax=Tilletia horrida TaxID=155126 RepID=A0AAN6K0X9_9BASI|nr:hypothetical protein OC846_000348 [Tilletia horrida]
MSVANAPKSRSPAPPVIDLAAHSPNSSPELGPTSSVYSNTTKDNDSATTATSLQPASESKQTTSVADDSAQAAELRKEIITMLSPPAKNIISPGDNAFSYSRQLPVTILYDERGLKIYDRLIDEAHEYYLFNAELQILKDHSVSIAKRILDRHQHQHNQVPPQQDEDRRHGQRDSRKIATEKDVWGSSKVGVHNNGVNGEVSLRNGAFTDRGSAPANRTAPAALIELGAGSLRKTVHLLRAFGHVWGQQAASPDQTISSSSSPPTNPTQPLKYYALDLSRAELDRTLGELAEQEGGQERDGLDGKSESVLYDGTVSINGIWSDYGAGLKFIGENGLAPRSPAQNATQQGAEEGKRIFLWLGSSIGNFSPRSGAACFLRDTLCDGNRPEADASPAMRPGDYMLIGIDRRNDPATIARAYHDSLGITKEFILNGLLNADRVLRANTELDGEAHAGSVIDVRKFAYHDRYAEPEGRHESYYRSLERQTIRIPPLLASNRDVTDGVDTGKHDAAAVPRASGEWTEVTLEKDELIHVEVSIKYSQAERAALLQAAGLREVQAWTDDQGRYDVVLVERPPFVFGSADSLPHEPTLDVLNFEAEAKKEAAKADLPPANNFGLPTWAEWEKTWHAWNTITLGMIPQQMLFEKPIDLRHICLFYLGHIPAFLDIHLSRYLQEPDTNKWFSSIFERGIDPHMDDPTQCHAHSEVPTKNDDWPALESIIDYQKSVVARLRSIYDGIAEGKDLGNTGKSLTKRTARMIWMVKEHQELHMETLLYMLVQSATTQPPPGFTAPDFAALAKAWDTQDEKIGGKQARQALVEFATPEAVVLGHDDIDKDDHKLEVDPAQSTRRAGETEEEWIARLNHLLADPEFGWDNESPARTVQTGKFSIRATPVTNEDYMEFFSQISSSEERQGAFPPSWVLRDGNTTVSEQVRAEDIFVRTVYGPVPLSQSRLWPVQASGTQLAKFAKFVGGRLPTQAELLRLWDHERAELAKAPTTRNWTDDTIAAGKNVGFKHWHPIPAVPAATAKDNVPHNGGVFEWTSTVFDNYEGFTPSELYPAYSVDFFDGKHRVVLGGSWATTPSIASRRSFTNEYQEPYGMIFGGARVAFDL